MFELRFCVLVLSFCLLIVCLYNAFKNSFSILLILYNVVSASSLFRFPFFFLSFFVWYCLSLFFSFFFYIDSRTNYHDLFDSVSEKVYTYILCKVSKKQNRQNVVSNEWGKKSLTRQHSIIDTTSCVIQTLSIRLTSCQ